MPGTDEDEEEIGETGEEDMLRAQTVEDFLGLLDKPKLPEVLAQVSTYVQGNRLSFNEDEDEDEHEHENENQDNDDD